MNTIFLFLSKLLVFLVSNNLIPIPKKIIHNIEVACGQVNRVPFTQVFPRVDKPIYLDYLKEHVRTNFTQTNLQLLDSTITVNNFSECVHYVSTGWVSMSYDKGQELWVNILSASSIFTIFTITICSFFIIYYLTIQIMKLKN